MRAWGPLIIISDNFCYLPEQRTQTHQISFMEWLSCKELLSKSSSEDPLFPTRKNNQPQATRTHPALPESRPGTLGGCCPLYFPAPWFSTLCYRIVLHCFPAQNADSGVTLCCFGIKGLRWRESRGCGCRRETGIVTLPSLQFLSWGLWG